MVWMILWIPGAFLVVFRSGAGGGRGRPGPFVPFSYVTMVPAAVPGLFWAITRARERSRYHQLLRVADRGGCASCGYGGHAKDPNLCPECARELDHARADAEYWHARL